MAGVVAVTLVALAAFDAGAVTTMRRYLLNQTDSNLKVALTLTIPRLPAILPPGNVQVRFFVNEAMLPRLKFDDVVNVRCDGCAEDITAKVSFISRTSEFTPPVIYSLDERHKLVFMIEARSEHPELLRVGQPVSVTLAAPGSAP